MIYDRLDRIDAYRPLSPRIARAIDFAVAHGGRVDLALGRHEIEGDDVFALVQTYLTKPAEAAKWEAHRKYVDLQLMLVGTERMDVADVGALVASGPFDVEKDVGFFEPPEVYQPLVVPAGSFAIFFPHDAHRPTVSVGPPGDVRKVVVKVCVG